MSDAISTFDFPDGAVPAPELFSAKTAERLVIGGVVVLTTGLIFLKPGLARYEFPVVSFLAGIYLYYANPARYVSFTIWLYFLSPFIRRLVDYRSSWVNPSPVLLAPLLTTGITGLFLLSNLNRSWFRRSSWPYLFALSGIAAGFFSGVVINHDLKDVLSAALNWIAPICFGCYIAAFPGNRSELRKVVIRTFVTGALLMGLYGIYQFAQAPPWDCNWLEEMNSGDLSVSVMGRPEPFGLRVWGTMNSPGPFSTALSVALLLVFLDERWVRIPAALAAFVSLLLSLVRSGWIGFTAGLFRVLMSSRKYLLRVLIGLGLSMVVLFPAFLYKPFADAVSIRLQSLLSMNDDDSASERTAGYRKLSGYIEQYPLGLGLTNSDRLDGYVLDSTLLRLPLQLGWAGCLLYVIGIGLVAGRALSTRGESHFALIARAIVISVLVRAPFGQVLVSFDGFVLWMFCGLAMLSTPRTQVLMERSSQDLNWSVVR